MGNFHFKQAGVFHLQKLQYLVREITGLRYKLNDHESLSSLIEQVVNMSDERVNEEFALFYDNCWPCTQEYISSELLIK